MASQALTGPDIEFYRREGYLVVPELLSAEQVKALQSDTDAMVAAAASVRENDAVYDLEDTHTAQAPRVRRIKEPHRNLRSCTELMRDASLVNILTQLIGPGVRFQTSKLNMKAPEYGAPVEWHQDWAFYPHTNDDLLAVGVMLDDMRAENGPLMVIPGSHRGPVYDHHHDGYFCGAINPDNCDLDFDRAVELTGPAGSVSFHHVRMVHGSALNRSTRPRRLLLFQYTAADAFPLVNFDNNIEAYDGDLVAGAPTLVPRLADVPIRLPLPPAPNQGSIYENQRGTGHRFFEHYAPDRATQ